MANVVNGKLVQDNAGSIVNGRFVAGESSLATILREQNASNLAPTAVGETPAQTNERILGSLGLDTVLTPKKKKTTLAAPAQAELTNLLGE